MTDEINRKLNALLDSIKSSLADIKREGRKARELKKTVKESRDIVTEVLEQQLGGVSLEDQINITEIPDEDWIITARHIISLINAPFVPRNQYEIYFMQIINYLRTTDKDTLLSNLIFSLNKMMQEDPENYDVLTDQFIKFPFWDTYNQDEEDYTTFELRLSVLKHHSYDLLWLYKHTEDFLSKRTLAAVIMNWVDLQISGLASVKSTFKNYCEPDIFADNKNGVFVDVGAFTGDTLSDYSQVYGKGYKKIYAYEPSPVVFNDLRDNVEKLGLHDVEIRRKGVGSRKGKMFYQENFYETSASIIAEKGDESDQVDIVRLDDDLDDIPTLIKINVNGYEKEALEGCRKTITKHSPGLAVCMCYDYDDIWKVPSMIEEMVPEYKFYIRHYGNCVVPTDFVLFSKASRN